LETVKAEKRECFEVNRYNHSNVIDNRFEIKGLKKLKTEIEIGRGQL
jgi:hypothetical protein